MAKKSDLIAELVNDWGYEEADLKGFTNAKLTNLIKQEKKDAEELKKEEEKEKKPQKRQVSRDDYTTIMNGTSGRVKYSSDRTGQVWEFTEYGQTDEITVGELINIRNRYGTMLRDAWIIILDEDVVEYLGLKEMYKYTMTPDQLEKFFELNPEKVEEILSKAPHGVRQLVAGIAKQKYENDELYDVRKIKAIEESLNIELDI